MHKPTVLLRLIGLLGITFGVIMMVSPRGILLGMPLGWLSRAPVKDYFWPGILIATMYGVAPIILSVLPLERGKRNMLINTLAICGVGWTMFEAIAFSLFHWLHLVFVVLFTVTILANKADPTSDQEG